MTLDQSTIRDLIDFSDRLGVLSFYVGHTPAQAADPQPTAPIEIRNQLRELKSGLAGRDGDLAKAVERRIAKLGPELDGLLDPKRSGRGRALFVGVQDGARTEVSVQVPFRERVVHHDRAYIRPLVAAYDEGRPAGILVVSRAGARLLEWSLGEIDELERSEFDLTDDQIARSKSGPSPGNPQHPHHGHVNRERFEDRFDENHQRFLRTVVERVAATASERGWDRLVLSGPPKVREVTEELLRAGTEAIRVLVAEPAWEEAAPSVIADQAWPLLRSVHRYRERELVDHVFERTFGGGPAAVGLRNVCQALNQGRIAHLVYDTSAALEGYVSEEGTLHPRVEGLAAQAELAMTREPLFVERLLEQAIATNAAVTPIDDDEAAGRLRQHEGVGALLRW